MSYTKIIRFVFLTFFTTNLLTAQKSEASLWSVGVGYNAIDLRRYMEVNKFVKDYFEVGQDVNLSATSLRLSADRYLTKGFTLQLATAVNTIRKGKEYDSGDPLKNSFFISLNTQVKYDLNELFFETGWFDPFVLLGTGYMHMGQVNTFNMTFGYGFNAWFNGRMGTYFQSAYNHHTGPWPTDYFQHSIGLIYRLKNPEPPKIFVSTH